MQKNSTSTIVRRLVLALVFAVITHVIARSAWATQAFGMNSPGNTCDNWYFSFPRSYDPCEPVDSTSFFQYTTDWWPIIGTHAIGVVAAIIIFAIGHWIFFSGMSSEDEIPQCIDPHCPCTWHKGEVFENGKWVITKCTNQSCTCVSHKYEKFDISKGYWV